MYWSPCALETSCLKGDGIRRSGEDSVLSSERLSTGTNAQIVLGSGEALLLGKVGEELGQVTRVVLDLAGSNEAENGGRSVGSLVELPGFTANGGGINWGAGGRDGACTTKGGGPDHDLVLSVPTSSGRGEDVVRHITDEVVSRVADRGCQQMVLSVYVCVAYLHFQVDWMLVKSETFLVSDRASTLG